MNDEIIRLYKSGLSHRQIARLLDLTQYRVQRTLKDAKVHRTMSEAMVIWHAGNKVKVKYDELAAAKLRLARAEYG